MALPTGLRLSCFGDGKFMPGMAAGTASFAAVRIYPANAHVGPGVLTKFSVFDLHHAAMALVTAGRTLNLIVHAGLKPGINFPDYLKRIGVLA